MPLDTLYGDAVKGYDRAEKHSVNFRRSDVSFQNSDRIAITIIEARP
jgi:hypothetical protein